MLLLHFLYGMLLELSVRRGEDLNLTNNLSQYYIAFPNELYDETNCYVIDKSTWIRANSLVGVFPGMEYSTIGSAPTIVFRFLVRHN